MTQTELELTDILFEIIDFIDDAVKSQYSVGSEYIQNSRLVYLEKLKKRTQALVRAEN